MGADGGREACGVEGEEASGQESRPGGAAAGQGGGTARQRGPAGTGGTPEPSYVSSAARTRDYRQRVRNGRAVFRIEADVCALERALEEAGFLAPGTDDHDVVERALEKLIALLVADGDVSRHGIL
jgi:hypothetical protein